uniref:Uncharacterized protein n=1 Tax=viral metagenome TaxID=1070528 RepID=A0A6C0D0I0_9ZZZZ
MEEDDDLFKLDKKIESVEGGVFRPIREVVMKKNPQKMERRERLKWMNECGLMMSSDEMTTRNLYKRFPKKHSFQCLEDDDCSRFIPYWEKIRFDIHALLFEEERWKTDRYVILYKLNTLMESFGFSIKTDIYDIALGNWEKVWEEREIMISRIRFSSHSNQLCLYFFLKSFFAHPFSVPPSSSIINTPKNSKYLTFHYPSTLQIIRLWRRLVF